MKIVFNCTITQDIISIILPGPHIYVLIVSPGGANSAIIVPPKLLCTFCCCCGSNKIKLKTKCF